MSNVSLVSTISRPGLATGCTGRAACGGSGAELPHAVTTVRTRRARIAADSAQDLGALQALSPSRIGRAVRLVARDAWIDVLGPRVDAASEVVDRLEAELQEVLGRATAAAAVMAVERQRRLLRKVLD